MNEETEQLLTELERIVTERQDWLFRFAYMRIGIREDAEDLVQEVLLVEGKDAGGQYGAVRYPGHQ